MSLTKVSPSLFATSNNITSVTVGGSANTISLTFDGSGVITSATNNAVSVANTAITGNIISSQIASVSGSVITANTIANSAIQTGAVENYMSAAGLGFGMRNRIINGQMVLDQRNAGASVTPTNLSYNLDRWACLLTQSSKFTVQQNAGAVTPPVGFSKYLGATSSSAYSIVAGDRFGIYQNIESFNGADLAWGTANAKSITISFQVYSSLTGTFSGNLRTGSGTDYSYVFTYSIPVANTWTTISVTIAGPTVGTWASDNSTFVSVNFSLGVGSTYSTTAGSWTAGNYWGNSSAVSVVGTNGATFYITGVQLEKGSTATSFDYRSYGAELALCQRYYSALPDTGAQNGLGAGVCLNTSNFYFVAVYPVPMRTAPSFTSTGTFQVIVTTGYTPSSVTLSAAGTTSAALVAAISGPVAASGGFIRGGGSACSLNFSAEL